jgi:integrase/recombinase XerD
VVIKNKIPKVFVAGINVPAYFVLKNLYNSFIIVNKSIAKECVVMDELIQKMLVNMQLRGLSKGSCEEYVRHIKIFLDFCGKPLAEVEDEEIKAFLHHLISEKKLSASSVNVYNAALKFLFEKTLKRRWDSENLPRMKKPKKLPDVLTKEEVQSLFDVTENLKHKCILMTVYGSGLRLSDIIGLKVCDIDSKNMRIFIRQGKGKKDRYAILSQRSLDILREYWKVYKPQNWLFEGREKGTRYSHRSAQDLFKNAVKKAGIKKDVSIHVLRHSFAVHMLEANVNIFHIKELLGHSDITTTTIYLRAANMNALNIKSPLDSLGGENG